MIRTSRILSLAVVLTLGSALSGRAFDFTELENSVKEHTLANGMKFIVLERHDAPVVSFNISANVGSVDDPKEYTGLAHMFEHMAFKGTTSLGSKDIEEELRRMAVEDSLALELRAERLKGVLIDTARLASLTAAFETARQAAYEMVVPNEYQEVIRREGAVGINAGTGPDMTNYFYSLPSNKLELWMAMDSERFLHPVLREIYKERDVVAEERRMRVENSPAGKMYEELLGLSFKAHPYGIRGIGHMSDIQNFTRAAALDFFQKYYGPANLVAAIVGDVKAEEVFQMAERYWGRIAYRPKPGRIVTVEPPQLGERRMVIEDPSQPQYAAVWHIPEITHPDRAAIDAMVDYLGDGRTSLLYRSLVKQKMIAAGVEIFSGAVGQKYPTLVMTQAIPSNGHTNLECEDEIMAQMESVKAAPIAPTDLEKIKTRARAGFIDGLASNQGIARQLCSYQQYFGDWRQMFRELDRINAVTANDILRVANQYFTKNNRSVVLLETKQK